VRNEGQPKSGKPIAAISQPPTESEDGKGCSDGPPEREEQVRRKTENAKRHPEDFALHQFSLTRRAHGGAKAWQMLPNCDTRVTHAKLEQA
jgi:hypothetical protein